MIPLRGPYNDVSNVNELKQKVHILTVGAIETSKDFHSLSIFLMDRF